MKNLEYGIIRNDPQFLPVELIDLLRVPHNKKAITFSYPAFGPDIFTKNINKMRRFFSHQGQRIKFREPTTAESLSAAAYKFGEIETTRIVLYSNRFTFQLGRMVFTSEGFFANPPRDKDGKIITDEKILKSFLNNVKPVRDGNGVIYVVPNTGNLRNFGYAEYGIFKQGEQDSREFAESGLARVLEHTEEKIAKNISDICSNTHFKDGVSICNLESGNSASKIVSFHPDWYYEVGLCPGPGIGDFFNINLEDENYPNPNQGLIYGVLD